MLRSAVRRTASAAALLAVTLAAAAASANSAGGAPAGSAPQGANAIGADAVALFPLGGGGTHVLVGGVFKYEGDPTPSVGIIARLGYLYGPGDPNHGFSDLPLWVGVRYYPSGGGEGFHAGVDLGLNDLIIRDVDYAGRPKTLSAALWGANIPLGYKIDNVDIQAQCSMLAVAAPGASLAVGITLGYDLGRF